MKNICKIPGKLRNPILARI
ncbi:hypothetical protein F383_03984 [Gossypium arboreum]|uniref:Uncharacterized protein n=1 Tax=Gossypium arboreum TaxID=29729 RepID=A0A0B0PQM4_GOSAR|nr:hypothetical protein F383_03984 [Gossypium arboreum]